MAVYEAPLRYESESTCAAASARRAPLLPVCRAGVVIIKYRHAEEIGGIEALEILAIEAREPTSAIMWRLCKVETLPCISASFLARRLLSSHLISWWQFDNSARLQLDRPKESSSRPSAPAGVGACSPGSPAWKYLLKLAAEKLFSRPAYNQRGGAERNVLAIALCNVAAKRVIKIIARFLKSSSNLLVIKVAFCW